MGLNFNNKNLLPLTNIGLICILSVCAFYTDWVGRLFLGVCVLAQCLCLYGIYNKDESLMGKTHLMFALTIFVGTFLGRTIINYILVILLLFVIWTRRVRGSCMYDDYTKKYMDKIPLHGKGVDMFFWGLLLINIYYVLQSIIYVSTPSRVVKY